MTPRHAREEPGAEDSVAAEIAVRGGNPTPTEAAAVVAVVASALDDVRSEGEALTVPTPSAWDRSRKAPRTPLVPGSWRSFNGQR